MEGRTILFSHPLFVAWEIIRQGTCPRSKPLILLSLCSCVSVYKLAPSPVLLVFAGRAAAWAVGLQGPLRGRRAAVQHTLVPKARPQRGLVCPDSSWSLIFPSPCPSLPLAPYSPPPISQQWWQSGYRALTRSVAQYSRAQTVTVLATAGHKPSPSPSLTALPGTSLTPFCVWATQPVCLPQPLWNYLEAHLLASLHHDWQPAPPPSRAWAMVSSHKALGTWEGPKTWLE